MNFLTQDRKNFKQTNLWTIVNLNLDKIDCEFLIVN